MYVNFVDRDQRAAATLDRQCAPVLPSQTFETIFGYTDIFIFK